MGDPLRVEGLVRGGAGGGVGAEAVGAGACVRAGAMLTTGVARVCAGRLTAVLLVRLDVVLRTGCEALGAFRTGAVAALRCDACRAGGLWVPTAFGLCSFTRGAGAARLKSSDSWRTVVVGDECRPFAVCRPSEAATATPMPIPTTARRTRIPRGPRVRLRERRRTRLARSSADFGPASSISSKPTPTPTPTASPISVSLPGLRPSAGAAAVSAISLGTAISACARSASESLAAPR